MVSFNHTLTPVLLSVEVITRRAALQTASASLVFLDHEIHLRQEIGQFA